jgi:hypothetical protein
MPIAYLSRLTKAKEGETDMNPATSESDKPSFWQLIFLQSKVNGAPYNGEALPGRNWDWPKDTYLQKRLQQSRWFLSNENMNLN